MNFDIDDLIFKMNSENEYGYIIQMIRQNQRWYFYDIETATDPVEIMWTKRITQGFVFPSEEIVEEFKSDFITPRVVDILRVDRKKFPRSGIV